MGGNGHSDKTLPRENMTDEELRDLCISAVRQHRDEMRLWVSLRHPHTPQGFAELAILGFSDAVLSFFFLRSGSNLRGKQCFQICTV